MSSLLNNTFGALLLSTFISLPLYGITVAQTVEYFCLYPSDQPFLKIFVVAIFISDTLHSAILIHIWYVYSVARGFLAGRLMKDSYHYLVTDYFSPAALWGNVWSVNTLPLSMVLHTENIYRRGRELFEVPTTGVLRCSLPVCRVWPYDCFRSSTFHVIHHTTNWMSLIAFTIATGVDLALTGAFVAIMRKLRTGFKGTDTALKLLARYTMFATVLVSTLAIPTFVCSLVLRHSFVYLAISIPVTKVYTNSVLAVLNCRKFLPSPGSLNLNVTDDSQAGNIRISVLQDGYTLQGAGRRGNPKAVALRQGPASSGVVIDNSLARNHQELDGAEGRPGETNAA
ncbi:hypothetical protein V8D89_001667 [Ganoderma adspersum]